MRAISASGRSRSRSAAVGPSDAVSIRMSSGASTEYEKPRSVVSIWKLDRPRSIITPCAPGSPELLEHLGDLVVRGVDQRGPISDSLAIQPGAGRAREPRDRDRCRPVAHGVRRGGQRWRGPPCRAWHRRRPSRAPGGRGRGARPRWPAERGRAALLPAGRAASRPCHLSPACCSCDVLWPDPWGSFVSVDSASWSRCRPVRFLVVPDPPPGKLHRGGNDERSHRTDVRRVELRTSREPPPRRSRRILLPSVRDRSPTPGATRSRVGRVHL